jgi:hypothetical protein
MKRNFSEMYSALRLGEDEGVERDFSTETCMAKKYTSTTDFSGMQLESKVKDAFVYHQ